MVNPPVSNSKTPKHSSSSKHKSSNYHAKQSAKSRSAESLPLSSSAAPARLAKNAAATALAAATAYSLLQSTDAAPIAGNAAQHRLTDKHNAAKYKQASSTQHHEKYGVTKLSSKFLKTGSRSLNAAERDDDMMPSDPLPSGCVVERPNPSPTVETNPSKPPKSRDKKNAEIAGAVLGSTAGVAVMAGAVVVGVKHCQKKRRDQAKERDERNSRAQNQA